MYVPAIDTRFVMPDGIEHQIMNKVYQHRVYDPVNATNTDGFIKGDYIVISRRVVGRTVELTLKA
jgi:hypothetical protein